MITALIFKSTGKISLVLVAGWLFGGMPAMGQIELALTVAPVRALLYEPVQATVVIRNNTGGMLAFNAGQGAARFFFNVERNKNETARLVDRNPLLFGLKIVPAGITTNVFNLTSLYTMNQRGIYKVQACVEWNNTLLASPAIELEVLKGFEIARMIAGVPGEEGMIRVYILEYLPQEKGEQVYLRIEDAKATTIYGMYKLGYIVRARKPEMKIDESGNVHVLFQTVSMIFVHTAFTPYGVQLFSREYADRNNRISLESLPSGRVSVAPLVSGEGSGAESGSIQTQEVPVKVRTGKGGLFGGKSR